MTNINSIYESIVIANEADLAQTATKDEKDLLLQYPNIHIEVLKAKKKDVEYQFSSHKVIVQEYITDYLKGNITKEVYFEAILEEKTWRSKAVSYLNRIDNKIIELKCKQKLWQKNQNANVSSES